HIFIEATKLTGYAEEEAMFLDALEQGAVSIKGLIMAGIVLGLSGVLDDITISQSAIVHELKRAQPTLPFRELYDRAMRVGRDHIASLVNTLVLVYTGAALPLLLLFTHSSRP